MNQEKFYIVSELAAELEVPRTTVNDWLGRYEDYIEFSMRGRRKVFPESALEVLRNIKKMRDEGMNGFDIGEQLARQYPVKPQMSDLPTAEKITHSETNDEKLTDNATSSISDINKVKEKLTDNVLPEKTVNYELINSEFLKINDFLKEAEIKQQRNSRLNRIFFTSLIALVLLLAVSCVIFGVMLLGNMDDNFSGVKNEVKTNNLEFIEKLGTHNDEIKALRDANQSLAEKGQNELNSITLLLEKNRQDYQKNLDALQAELKRQQQDFERKVDELSKKSETAAAAAMLKAKSEFAQERLEMVKKMESLEKNLDAKNSELLKSQQLLLEKINSTLLQPRTEVKSSELAPKVPEVKAPETPPTAETKKTQPAAPQLSPVTETNLVTESGAQGK